MDSSSSMAMSMGSMAMGSMSDMASHTMSMASHTMSMASHTMSDMASHTMSDMASHTMSDMASHTMSDMASMTMSSMPSSTGMGDMGGMHMGGHSMGGHSMGAMHMYFTREFKNYPVLFLTLSAKNKAQAFGIFVFLFAMAFIARGFEFLKLYLENRVWKDHSNLPMVAGVILEESSIEKENFKKVNFDENDKLDHQSSKPPQGIVARVFRDIVLLILCFLPDLFGYALMLAAMTYTLTYFFGVVVGSACGRFFFEKLSRKLSLRPEGVFGRHC